jgi:hypothetical protein
MERMVVNQIKIILFIKSMNDFDSSIVSVKTLQELINTKDVNDTFKSSKNASKDSYLTMTFRSELTELSFKSVRWYFFSNVKVRRKQ